MHNGPASFFQRLFCLQTKAFSCVLSRWQLSCSCIKLCNGTLLLSAAHAPKARHARQAVLRHQMARRPHGVRLCVRDQRVRFRVRFTDRRQSHAAMHAWVSYTFTHHCLALLM